MIFDGHEGVRSWPNLFLIFVLIVEADPAIKFRREQPVWTEDFSSSEIETPSPRNGMIFPNW